METETTYAAIVIAIVTAIPPTIAAIAAALSARHAARVSTRTSDTVVAVADKADVAASHAQTAAVAASHQADAIHRLVNNNMSAMREELKIKDQRIALQHADLVAKEREITLLQTRNDQLHAIIEQLRIELQSVRHSEQSGEGDR